MSGREQMKIILRCHADRDCDLGCDYAFLDLTEEVARALREKYEAFEAFHRTSRSTEARWWFGSLEYFAPGGQYGAEQRPSDEEQDRVRELLEDLDDCIEVPDDFELPESVIARTECEEVVVSSGGIHFTCFPRHTNVVVATAMIDPALLKEVTHG